jgi:hypothetical protein
VNYFFFYKSFSDLDTLSPIVHILSKNNIPKNKIIIFMHSLGRSTYLNDNKLIVFLNNRAKVYDFVIFNYLNKIYYLLMGSEIINNLKKKIYILRVLNLLISKSIKYIFAFNLSILLLFFFFIKKKATVLFFGNINQTYCKLIKFLNKNSKIILISHGLKTHVGAYDKKFNHYLRRENNKLSNYVDKFIYTNLNQYNRKKISKKVSILGSARYDLNWTSELKKIYKKSFKEKNYILVLLDKVGHSINGQFKFFNKVEEINVILKYLYDQNHKCILKFHPNSLESEIKNYYILKNKKFNVISNEAQTFNLIKNCKILIAFNSSAILDGFLLKKKIILPLYCSNFRSLFPAVDNSVVANNFNIFKIKLKKCLQYNYVKNYNNNKLFLVTGNKDKNTIKKYYNLITSNNEK